MRIRAHFLAAMLCVLAVVAAASGIVEPNNGRAPADRLPASSTPATWPAARAPMANPYDKVLSVQKAQEEAGRKHAIAIRELAMKASRVAGDPDAVIRTRITRLLKQPGDLDPKATLDLLNLDSGPVEVERIPVEGGGREWMIPSISMLEDGDMSIGRVEESESNFLSDWELIRNARGETIVGRIGDPLSRIRVRVGMVLGEYGRIMAVRDTPDAHYLILESGDRIRGRPRSGGEG